MYRFPITSQESPSILKRPPELKSLFSLMGLKRPLTNFPVDGGGALGLEVLPQAGRILQHLLLFVNSAHETEVPLMDVP